MEERGDTMFFFFNENENKMGVPGFEQTMKPILIALEECGGRASIGKLDEATIRVMNLSEEVVNTDELVHTARSSSACFPVFQCTLSAA